MAKNKLVAVTGCAGFIGSHLSEKLISEGYKVIGIDNFSPYYDRSLKERNLENFVTHENFDFYEADLTDYNLKDLFKGVSTVYHLAAQAGSRSWVDFQTYTANNILTTQRVLEACKENGSKIIFSSSSLVYGSSKKKTQEDSKLNPTSPYVLTKEFGEKLCKLYHDTFDLNALVLRFYTVYGPRQRPDLAMSVFTEKIFNNKEVEIYGDGEQTRDFTYVKDTVEGIYLAGTKDIDFDIFNIGTEKSVSMNSLVEMLYNEAGKKPKIKHTKSKTGDVRHTLADISKAQKELGYKPKYSIEEGIKLYIDWYKEQRDK